METQVKITNWFTKRGVVVYTNHIPSDMISGPYSVLDFGYENRRSDSCNPHKWLDENNIKYKVFLECNTNTYFDYLIYNFENTDDALQFKLVFG